MSPDTSNSSSIDDEIHSLPDTVVVYMSIMKTKEGKPIGIPIWSSFDNKSEEMSLENESISSTFLSLANNVSNLAEDIDQDGKVIRISINKKTFNIFLPHHNDPFQICFVIVFEEKDHILIQDKHKTELIRVVRNSLAGIEELVSFVEVSTEEQILKKNPLYEKILAVVTDDILKWDKKRVKYLKDKAEEARRQAELDKIESTMELDPEDRNDEEAEAP